MHAAPGFDPTGRRSGGEWRVERQRLRWDILDAFAAAAQEAGIPATADFNRGNNEGVGYFEVNQRGGLRWSAAKAFLRPIEHRDNLQVWTGAQVSRVSARARRRRLEGGRHRSVAAGRRRAAARAARAREVILAAGAVSTPLMLQQSGIGPGAWLQQHGIEVRHDARASARTCRIICRSARCSACEA